MAKRLESGLKTYLANLAPEQKKTIADIQAVDWKWLSNQSACMQSRSDLAAQVLAQHSCERVAEIGGFMTPLSQKWAKHHLTPPQVYVNIDPTVDLDVQEDAKGRLSVQLPMLIPDFFDPSFQKSFPELSQNFDCVSTLGVGKFMKMHNTTVLENGKPTRAVPYPGYGGPGMEGYMRSLYKSTKLVVLEAAVERRSYGFNADVIVEHKNFVRDMWASSGSDPGNVQTRMFDCTKESPGVEYQMRQMFIVDRTGQAQA